ncbi:MAG: argininosuccinate synthase, partial [Lysobacteraceae bacterium]
MSPQPNSTNPQSPLPNPASAESKDIVLAFSGGLDTSFCVPWLKERGWRVHTVFADTGGVDAAERTFIEQRAAELGVASHLSVDGGAAIWEDFVRPFVWAGQGYQGQYPLLVSDRYLIVDAALRRAAELGTNAIAHGCTGMGNDQVRFDLAVKAQGSYRIVAPIREIQKQHTQTRAYEQAYLEERGFGVRAKQQQYTINENLLGVTLSGGEIDRWEAPGDGARGWCAPREVWPAEPLRVALRFVEGEAVALDGEILPGAEILARLNAQFARYGVGRGMYTGDTTIGLKGRIVYEAPGLTALLAAHRALEEAVLSKQQNRFKPDVARRWVELVYEGFFHDPLKADL